MLIRLGKPAPAGGDAVALLLECHERIRAFLALARHIGEARSSQAQPIAEAADQVVRYFTEALPLHARDEEEESVLPRLRGKEPMVDAELEEMAREHAGHDGPLRTVVAACAELAHDPTRHEPRQRAAESEKIDRPLGRSRQPVIRLSCRGRPDDLVGERAPPQECLLHVGAACDPPDLADHLAREPANAPRRFLVGGVEEERRYGDPDDDRDRAGGRRATSPCRVNAVGVASRKTMLKSIADFAIRGRAIPHAPASRNSAARSAVPKGTPCEGEQEHIQNGRHRAARRADEEVRDPRPRDPLTPSRPRP